MIRQDSGTILCMPPEINCSIKDYKTYIKQDRRNGTKYLAVVNGKHGWRRHHVCLIEDSIGRSLHKKECVHHIDSNPLNNDLKNLRLRTWLLSQVYATVRVPII